MWAKVRECDDSDAQHRIILTYFLVARAVRNMGGVAEGLCEGAVGLGKGPGNEPQGSAAVSQGTSYRTIRGAKRAQARSCAYR